MQPPPHPTSQLTTYELAAYRRELEHQLKTVPEHAGGRDRLAQQLADVLAEQESRATIASAR